MALGVLSVFALSACEGDSVLDNGGTPDGDPPTISSVDGPENVRAGDTFNLTIEAEAAAGRVIDSMRVVLRTGAVTVRDTVVQADPVAATISQDVSIPLGPTLNGTQLATSVIVYSGETPSAPQTIATPIADDSSPTIEILAPPQPIGADTTAIGTGATLRVAADISDASGISRVSFIGVAYRGDADLGTDTTVVRFEERIVDFPVAGADTLPTDTILRRDLPQIGGDVTEVVHVIVTVTDGFGNVSADTVPLSVGGPDVRFLSPNPDNPAPIGQGTEVQVRVQVVDRTGIESVNLYISGVHNETVPLPVTGLPDSTVLTHTIDAASLNTVGQLTMVVRARNSRGVLAPSAPLTIQVIDNTEPDAEAPGVNVEISSRRPVEDEPLGRLEQMDTIFMSVTTEDPGVSQIGVIVEAILNGAASTTTLEVNHTYTTPRSNPDTVFAIAVRDLYSSVDPNLPKNVSFPDPLSVQARAFATDVNGNSDTVSVAKQALAVAGFTARLPGRGIISDAVVDPVASQLYLSNFTQSRVDVLSLVDTSFVDDGVLAGSQPWGMFIDNSGDTLLVANSGGTNITKVPLRDAPLEEDHTTRIFTPNVVLYELEIALDAALVERYKGTVFGFSDRPQFLAQAAGGPILFSTVPTPAAADGTIRIAERQAGWQQHEVRLLYPGGDPADETVESQVVIANADSLAIVRFDAGDSIFIYDHVPGFPGTPANGFGSVMEAVTEAQAAGSDVELFAGGYDPTGVGVQDTTFVAASGDREWIAFGEGATADVGRIIMWNESTGQSSTIEVADLIHNAAERVTGIGLNDNGTLGVARGDFAAYYFSRDLRLQGLFSEGINPGGFGATLHPDHAQPAGPSNATTLSFVGTAESTVKMIDTFHFFELGELPIKDPIVGPLRASLPLAGDNAGVACPGPACVVVKLFGVVQSEGSTRPDGVVIIDVREQDLQ